MSRLPSDALKILLDGTERLSLGHGGEARLHVRLGEHTVQAKMDWCRLNVLRDQVQTEERVIVDCDSPPLASLCCFGAPGRVLRVTASME